MSFWEDMKDPWLLHSVYFWKNTSDDNIKNSLVCKKKMTASNFTPDFPSFMLLEAKKLTFSRINAVF